MMLIYNTLSGQKEDLNKALGGSKKIRLFVCGPTVYDYSHIGHGRTYLAFDVFVRYLRSRGYKIFYLQNITDVDDRIIRRALEQKKNPLRLADNFTKAHLQDMKTLGITSVTKYVKATDFIKEIIQQVQALIKKSYAYKIDGDGYYFDISKFPDYGKLSHRTITQAEDGVSRIDENFNKRNKGDFCLWKFSKPNEPVWDTPLGKGRPGWHIEDTAISEHFFGPQYDLHGGGLDLKFPHHEAEIAQQESASGKTPFVKIWMHAGMLTVDGEKMAKSVGNFVTIRDFLKQHSPAVLRWVILTHHYRSPLDFKPVLTKEAEQTFNGFSQFISRTKLTRSKNASAKINLKKYEADFYEKLDDDFNTPEAIAVIFELINEVNKKIWNLSKTEAREIAQWVISRLDLLGIKLATPKIPLRIRMLAKKRELSRTRKQFVKADSLRKQIEGLGYIIEDTPNGPFIWPK